MVNKDSQYHEVLSELSRYSTGILCGIKNDYHAGRVSQLLDSATRLFKECHLAYQECERAANAMEAANTSANKASAPCEWKCSCGQVVVGDYCKCGAYRCDL